MDVKDNLMETRINVAGLRQWGLSGPSEGFEEGVVPIETTGMQSAQIRKELWTLWKNQIPNVQSLAREVSGRKRAQLAGTY
jgi:hypothetical protein